MVDLGIVSRESRVPPGFTAIGIIVIAAVAYSIRISLDPAAGNNVLTATFLLANIVGWLLGWRLLLLELPNVHLLGFGLLAAAIVVAANRADGPWLAAVLGVCASVLLWRSLVRDSSFAHLMFMAAAAGCAVLLMPGRGEMQTLPVAILVAMFCIIELLSVRKPSSFHADVTSVVALALAIAILLAEVTSARFSIYAVGTLVLAAFAVQARRAQRRIHRHRQQDVRRAQSRRPRSDPDPEQRRQPAPQRRRQQGAALRGHGAWCRLDAYRPRDETGRGTTPHDGVMAFQVPD